MTPRVEALVEEDDGSARPWLREMVVPGVRREEGEIADPLKEGEPSKYSAISPPALEYALSA
jgi:hypothetical protein